MEDLFRPPRLDVIELNSLHPVFVLRDDLIHPYLSGNKWRKLKYNIKRMISEKKETMITFGGAFSNHLVAAAAAGQLFGFRTVGIVRGEPVDNHRIRFLRQCGMHLHFITREAYRKKNDPSFTEELKKELEHSRLISVNERIEWIPEGGSNSEAIRGTAEIPFYLPPDVTTIFCACGTGGTVAGISQNLKSYQRVIAVPVLKGAEFLKNDVESLGGNLSSIEFLFHYHFGGYAKTDETLDQFCKTFFSETSIPIEPVYTGKLFYAVNDQIEKGFISRKEKIAIIHSGGIFPMDPKC